MQYRSIILIVLDMARTPIATHYLVVSYLNIKIFDHQTRSNTSLMHFTEDWYFSTKIDKLGQ